MTTNLPVVVFTDVDGILYDPRTYSFDHAATLLDRLDQRRAPLVLCSDKSHVELERVRYLLGINHPFVAEDRAVVFVPHGYFDEGLPDAHDVAGYLAIEAVRPRESVRIAVTLEWFVFTLPTELRAGDDRRSGM